MELLDHTPPVDVSVNVILSPLHTADGPVITAGNGFTVIFSLRVQPLGCVYIISGLPAATPVTTPVLELTVARELLEDVHVPLSTASDKVMVNPGHTLPGPVTGDVGKTVTVCVT